MNTGIFSIARTAFGGLAAFARAGVPCAGFGKPSRSTSHWCAKQRGSMGLAQGYLQLDPRENTILPGEGHA
ncbi:MAG: hypothetical protein Q4G70_05895 [Pseudomonadota bacterium]|nr:hypothetical protein [Pseudomonadota bacterium]